MWISRSVADGPFNFEVISKVSMKLIHIMENLDVHKRSEMAIIFDNL